MGQAPEGPELGVLSLSLVPERCCTFSASPAASLRAALLRRLELFDPDLSYTLHHTPEGASSTERPWTVSPLLGPLTCTAGSLAAEAGQTYRVRITGLAPRILDGLNAAFLSNHTLAREPLHLERVPFRIGLEGTHWESLGTYAALLTGATPQRRISLAFRSPTSFRRGGRRTGQAPEPRTCFTGYLLKWNAFSPVLIPEDELLEYVSLHLKPARQELRPAPMKLGRYVIPGVVGTVEWLAEGGAPHLLRLVNALADYAFYCGTGTHTTQGMGQTVLVRR
jgi:CRISPR-associated endoribonuclease Cas6